MINFNRLMMNALFASALLSFGVQAEKSAAFDEAAISDVLKKYQLNISSIEASPIAGLFEVVTDQGVIYTTSTGDYFVYGQLFHTSATGIVNLTEPALAKRNKVLFENSGVREELIVYPAKDEKYVVNVFTDTTCGYCMKLHREMKDYNDLGITIRYIAFPRSGERSPNLSQMNAIWCAKDKVKAMDLAKAGKFTETDTKCAKVIDGHMALGNSMGVSGTPAIMLEDGTMLSGYLPAAQLLKTLENNQKSKAK